MRRACIGLELAERASPHGDIDGLAAICIHLAPLEDAAIQDGGVGDERAEGARARGSARRERGAREATRRGIIVGTGMAFLDARRCIHSRVWG